MRKAPWGYMRFFSVATSLGLIFVGAATLYPFPNTKGATINDLRSHITQRNDEIRKLEAEIAAYQKTLSETSQHSKTLQGEIQRLNTQIKKLTADIRLTEKRISATQLEISELKAEIATKEEKIDLERSAIAEILHELYIYGNASSVELLLGHASLSDFFGDISYSESLTDSIRAHISELREIKAGLEEEKRSQEEKEKGLLTLQDDLSDRKRLQENGKRDQEQLLTVTKSKETAYQTLLKDREEKRLAALDEIQRIEDELRKLIDPTSLPIPRAGVLAWPIKGTTLLTQSFGNTPEAKVLYNGKPHNGIDIKASVGTPVYAAEAGVVRGTGDTDAFPRCLSYGKWALIDHPNNLSTLYAHLSLIKVAKGDTVSKEQLIGYAGATGYATGPHLHFTVYDSRTVEFRSSSVTNSGCKLLPFGGYLNPLAYL